ncbi:MAG: hypothetical protein LQ337_004360 [Flavoplaca oasis]|nr:MAG: hypothetical protein LQ337_004360 [Flavoplaca oasis]
MGSTSLAETEDPATVPPRPPEIQTLWDENPGTRTYNASNAADFQDIRGGLASDEHIRLVEVSSLSSESRLLSLKFLSVRLDNSPEYSALSYTWGPPGVDPLSNINGYRFTPNLIACLSELMFQAPGLWWIDALCINQDDLDEKSQQVKKMRDIYARAHRVYVWLGPTWTDSNPNFNDGLAGMHILNRIQHLGSQGAIDNGGPPLKFANGQLQKLEFPEIDSPIWQGLVTFLCRPYFSRMWVLQELTVAKGDIFFMCGDMILNYHTIYNTIEFMKRQGWKTPLLNLSKRYGLDTGLPAFDFIDTITLFRVHHQTHKEASLLLTLDHCRNYQSTDPRDKIIALLGIIAPEELALNELQPDYSQPASEYFREVTGALIMHHRSYHVLTMVEARCGDDNSLPSWVPDYGTRWNNPFHALQYIEESETSFDGQRTPGSNILRVSACILDEIETVSLARASIGADIDAIVMTWLSMAAVPWEADIWDWLSRAVDDQDGVWGKIDSFWRTLIGNQWVVDGLRTRDAPANCLYLFLGNVLKSRLKLEYRDKSIGLMDAWKEKIDVQRLVIDPLYSGEADAYRKLVLDSGAYNTFFLTKAGRMGLGPWTLQSGDKVTTLAGGNSLLYIRGGSERAKFVGHGYVHGLMNGSELDLERQYLAMNLE